MNGSGRLRVDVSWHGDLRFLAGGEADFVCQIDGDRATGLSPMQGLLGCLGASVGSNVLLLVPGGTYKLRTLQLHLTGECNPAPPRYLRRVQVTVQAAGSVSRDALERAIDAALRERSGVWQSLRADVKLDYVIRLADENGTNEP